jgi:aryl-alcohol dehydrogenase-like predicted oxidoreductase
MEYVRLGKTGLQVSRICLGCMSFGTPGWNGWNWLLDEDAAEPFFKTAVEQGVNFFDTADSYSAGKSEEIMGKWLKQYANRDEVVIATKVFGGRADRPNMRGLSHKHIQQACEDSLRRLGVETIDLYQIHRFDPNTPLEETLFTLHQLVVQGKVRYIGASLMYVWQFMRALHVADQHGWTRFVSMQNHYNLLYREEERDMIPLCQAEGVGMIPWSPLARGVLARQPEGDASQRAEVDDLLKFYQLPGDNEIITEVNRIAQLRGMKPAQIALAWMFSKPVVAAPIVGVSKLSHLEDAIDAVGVQLTQEEIDTLERFYQPKPTLGITMPYSIPRPGAVHDRPAL